MKLIGVQAESFRTSGRSGGLGCWVGLQSASLPSLRLAAEFSSAKVFTGLIDKCSKTASQFLRGLVE
jgi:hypothetical protein